jgi:hypothetical protein
VKHQSIIKLARELGLCISCCGEKYWVSNRLYKLEWQDQDGFACCPYISKHSDIKNYAEDYFPGFFPKTLKEIRFQFSQ